MTIHNFIFENNLNTREEKIKFLDDHSSEKIIMDLTAFDKTDFFKNYPQLIAATSTKLNLTPKCEVATRSHQSEVSEFLLSQGLSPVFVTALDGYFHLPRILSTIINEAFYALEDGIATPEDIDRAMKFGVNYPEGPFTWCKGREAQVVTLLDNMFEQTKNERYRASQALRNRSLIN